MAPTKRPRPPTLSIVIAGDLSTGFRFYGPHDDEDAAEDFRAELEIDGGKASFVAPLQLLG